jgi:hypothetical protein
MADVVPGATVKQLAAASGKRARALFAPNGVAVCGLDDDPEAARIKLACKVRGSCEGAVLSFSRGA